MNKVLEKRVQEMEKIAKEMGLSWIPIYWEVVPQAVMTEVASYGLPHRARHWHYGQSYEYQKITGEIGHSKIYELVLNSEPSYAFLLDTNSDIANSLVIAHVIGHSTYFLNNYLFKQTDRKMVYHAAERATRVDEYIEKYGIEAVEHMMNIAFALDKCIDWHKGRTREKYSQAPVKIGKRSSNKASSEFDDLIKPPEVKKQEEKFPPYPEYDLLWFFMNYADLEDWQKDILYIVREESFYFYPQYSTKISNEGFAVFVHSEIMARMDEIDHPEHMEFCRIHERVVQPGGNPMEMNPYFLGFVILDDIRKKWDKKFKDGESDIDGIAKVVQVISEEDDISLIKNYLTQEMIDEHKMFAYEHEKEHSGAEYVTIKSNSIDSVAEHLVKKIYNYTSPLICITKASNTGIELEHHSTEVGTLDEKHIGKVMEYIFWMCKVPVNLQTIDDEGNEMHFTYDEEGFSGEM
jgi:stage V sporulation protein R